MSICLHTSPLCAGPSTLTCQQAFIIRDWATLSPPSSTRFSRFFAYPYEDSCDFASWLHHNFGIYRLSWCMSPTPVSNTSKGWWLNAMLILLPHVHHSGFHARRKDVYRGHTTYGYTVLRVLVPTYCVLQEIRPTHWCFRLSRLMAFSSPIPSQCIHTRLLHPPFAHTLWISFPLVTDKRFVRVL